MSGPPGAAGRLVVFGATGGTGRQIVRQALDAGLAVVAPVRRPAALDIRHPALDVVRADVLRPADLRGLIGAGDRVASVLGIGMSRAATTLYSAGTANVLAAMAEAGARRMVCVSTTSLASGPGPSAVQRAFTRQVLHRILSRPYADMRRMEAEVSGADGLDWTIVRAARLTDGRRRGRYRVGSSGTLRSLWSISRADLATYVLAVLDDGGRIHRTVDIAY